GQPHPTSAASTVLGAHTADLRSQSRHATVQRGGHVSETPRTSGQPADQRFRQSDPEPATMTNDHAAAAAAPGAIATPITATAPGAPTTSSATPGATTTPGAATTSGATTSVTGLRRSAFLGYRWALLAFLLAGVAQICLAGLGVFRLQEQGLEAAG